MKDYVYVMEAQSGFQKGKYKIGRTINPVARIGDVKQSSHSDVVYISIFPTNQSFQLETEYHSYFDEFRYCPYGKRDGRRTTEWFNLPEDIVEQLRNIPVNLTKPTKIMKYVESQIE